jgi:hypothetical protein
MTTTPPITGPPRQPPRTHANWLVFAVALVGLASHLPSLRWGFLWDDFFHQAALRGLVPDGTLPVWNLYDFMASRPPAPGTVEAFVPPWWTDAGCRVRFFRPITSFTIWLDYRLYHDWAPGYHLTSLAWFAVFLALVWRLLRGLDLPPAATLWAFAIVALDDVHGIPVGWIANRNSLIAAVFTVATLLAVRKYLHTRGLVWLGAAVIAFLLACGAKESGLATAGLAVLYVLVYGSVPGETARTAIARTLRSPVLWTFGALSVAYLVFYVAAGYGAHCIEYPAPWQNPPAYLRRLVISIPAALLNLFFGFPSGILMIRPDLSWLLAIVATVVLIPSLVVILHVTRWNRHVTFVAGWVAITLLIEAGGPLSERLWMMPSIGTAILAGLFLHRWRPLRTWGWRWRVPIATVALGVLIPGIVGALPANWLRGRALSFVAGHDREVTRSAAVDRSAATPREVILLNSPSPLQPLIMPLAWRVMHGDCGTRFYPLQFGGRSLACRRDDDATLTVTSHSYPLRSNAIELVLCTSRTPPPVGTTCTTPAFTATILETEPEGVHRVQFRFTRSLDDPVWQFLAYQGGALRRIAPPAVGETLILPELSLPNPYQ